MKTVESAYAEDVSKPTPEQELAAAVMGEALIDLQRGPVDREWRKVYEETRHWVRSGSVDWPYSFVNLCAIFGLDEELTRETMLAVAPTGYGKRALPSLRNHRHKTQMSASQRNRKTKWWSRLKEGAA